MSNRKCIQWHRARKPDGVTSQIPWNLQLFRPPWLPMKLESRETLQDNVASENGWLEDERSFWEGLFFQGLCWRPCQFHGGYTNHIQNCKSGSNSEFASPKVVNYIDRCSVSLSVVTLSHLDLYLIHWRKWANKTIYTKKASEVLLPCNNPT